MPQHPSTRLHPIAAIRAMRSLMRDREDTRQVFLLMDALRGKTSLRQFARFRQTETGRAVLAERRQLFDRLSDREALRRCRPARSGARTTNSWRRKTCRPRGWSKPRNFAKPCRRART